MSIDLGTIIEDLLLEEDRLEGKKVETAKTKETMTTARLIITQLQQENAELRRHLNPPPADPVTEAEAPF